METASVGSRTAQDACATLVELGRALKGWLFYQAGSPARRDLGDRAWRVLQGEVGRNGPLALEVRRGALWLAGTEVAVGTGRLDDLAHRFAERSVHRIVFEAELDSETVGALLGALVAEPAAGSFESILFAEPRRGVHVNDTDWRVFSRFRDAASLDTTLPDLHDAGEIGDTGEPPALDILDGFDPLLPAASESVPANLAPEKPLDELAERLRELDECDDDARYRVAAQQLAFDARALIEQGSADAGYRALELLAAHAGDDAKRSFMQRESARESLGALGQGAVLQDLVRRSCEGDGDACVRATGMLRALGAPAAPRILDELELAPPESERHARLAGAFLAIGEEAAPVLADAIGSCVARRQNAALRLAGETQNPRLVPSLRNVLLVGAPDASREAARALTRIGDVTALEVLAEALESPKSPVVLSAAHALAATGRALAVPPLATALDRALAASELGMARDLVRALGRLARPEAVPALGGLLARGGFFQRRRLREIKVAALNALAHIPGHAADQALARAARSGSAQQRQAAELARGRRVRETARSSA